MLSRMRDHYATAVWVLASATVTGSAWAADAVTAGELRAPYPTLENLSLEWAITGDDDGDAIAEVRFRKAGEAEFRRALDLVRVPAGENEGFAWANKLSGSVFGLEPGTTYEIEVALHDPDGGDANESLSVATRALPSDAGNRVIAVNPGTIESALADAEPGDRLELADGTYSELVVPRDGTPEDLLILAAQNPGGAVVEGDVRIDGRAHVLVTGLAVHGKIKFNDAEGIVIRGVTIETPDDGIVAYGSGVRNALILDNQIHGPTLWREAALGVDGDNLGEGVQITGPGNVVAWNQVSGFRDCLSLLEDDEAVEQVSVDFYGNDLAVCADDAIEADFAMGNVRVYRNRIRDSFMGISSQPSLGGPTYFTRNALYNVLYQAFKLQRSSVGDVGFHNTVVKSGDAFSVNTSDVFSRAWFRNNLFLGGPGATYNGYDSGPGDVMMLPSADASCSFDYDGFGALGRDELAGRVGEVRFENLDQLRSSTTEAHAVQVGLDVFDAAVQFPEDPFAAPATPSLLLAEASAAVDQGEPLANVNDGFEGRAPDLGAFELGAEEPKYGPGAGARPGSEPSGGSAGEPAAGGASTGGRADGGGSNTGGRSESGGAASGGRNTTGGGASGDAAGGASSAGNPSVPPKSSDPEDSEDDGCSCSMPAHGSEHAAWAVLLGAAALAVRRPPRAETREK